MLLYFTHVLVMCLLHVEQEIDVDDASPDKVSSVLFDFVAFDPFTATVTHSNMHITHTASL